jgi:hypothetical protein
VTTLGGVYLVLCNYTTLERLSQRRTATGTKLNAFSALLNAFMVSAAQW